MSDAEDSPPTPETLEAVIEAAQDGARLDRVLAELWPQVSRSRLQALIREGVLRLDGATILDPSQRVKTGQHACLTPPPPTPARPEAQEIALEILHEDADLLVLMKPAGLVVHPAAGNPDGTLVNALIAHCGDSLLGIGGERRPGIVHRLDKDTSGLMVVAKTEAAHRELVQQFSRRTILRRYLALVWGRPSPAAGEIAGNIGRSPRDRKKMAVLAEGGRPAFTRYETLESFHQGTASLLSCRLKTGRTHQIRVHLSQAGHPLIGDPLYGRGKARKGTLPPALAAPLADFPRQALHAEQLGFRHPASGELLDFHRPPPADMAALLSALRGETA